jgi:hypothetical protein
MEISAAKSGEVFSGIGDVAGEGTGGHGGRRGQKDLRFLVAHAAGKVSIGGTDAFQGSIHAAKGIDRAPEAGCTTCIFGHFHTGINEDFSPQWADWRL